jgi:hypothetical protein
MICRGFNRFFRVPPILHPMKYRFKPMTVPPFPSLPDGVVNRRALLVNSWPAATALAPEDGNILISSVKGSIRRSCCLKKKSFLLHLDRNREQDYIEIHTESEGDNRKSETEHPKDAWRES